MGIDSGISHIISACSNSGGYYTVCSRLFETTESEQLVNHKKYQ